MKWFSKKPAPASTSIISRSMSRRLDFASIFLRHDGHYQISKAIRDLCVFSRHNIAHDAPFSRLDLICCRNILIYMDVAMQRRIIPLLHYALNPIGYLFLGSSENVGGFGELFDTIDARHRIFMRRHGRHTGAARLRVTGRNCRYGAAGRRRRSCSPSGTPSMCRGKPTASSCRGMRPLASSLMRR